MTTATTNLAADIARHRLKRFVALQAKHHDDLNAIGRSLMRHVINNAYADLMRAGHTEEARAIVAEVDPA